MPLDPIDRLRFEVAGHHDLKQLEVVATVPGKSATTRAGYTLSVFSKQKGKWLLARDANLLAPVSKP